MNQIYYHIHKFQSIINAYYVNYQRFIVYSIRLNMTQHIPIVSKQTNIIASKPIQKGVLFIY